MYHDDNLGNEAREWRRGWSYRWMGRRRCGRTFSLGRGRWVFFASLLFALHFISNSFLWLLALLLGDRVSSFSLSLTLSFSLSLSIFLSPLLVEYSLPYCFFFIFSPMIGCDALVFGFTLPPYLERTATSAVANVRGVLNQAIAMKREWWG